MTKRSEARDLDALSLTYAPVGATAVADDVWEGTPPEFRRYERTADVSAFWEEARTLMFRWGVKTRSGFAVRAADGSPDPAVVERANYSLRFAVGPLGVTEPVRVVAVVDEPRRCGFAYGTLDGHPVSGEEAFIVSRTADGALVRLTIRSLTRPAARGTWRYAFPCLLVAQRMFRRRYLRSLNRTEADPSRAS